MILSANRFPHRLIMRRRRHGFKKGIIRLHHVRPAAYGVARRKKHETLRLEQRRAEMPARGEILGDLMTGGIAQARQRDMRREFASLRLEPDAPHQPLMFGLQFHKRRRGSDQRDNGARPVSAESRQGIELDLESLAPDLAEDEGRLARDGFIHVADEAQRHMIIFGIDPACPRQAPTRAGNHASYVGGDFQGGEKTRHGKLTNHLGKECTELPPGAMRQERDFSRARVSSSSTFGRIRATITSTPCALGWIPSRWFSLASVTTPSRKNG